MSTQKRGRLGSSRLSPAELLTICGFLILMSLAHDHFVNKSVATTGNVNKSHRKNKRAVTTGNVNKRVRPELVPSLKEGQTDRKLMFFLYTYAPPTTRWYRKLSKSKTLKLSKRGRSDRNFSKSCVLTIDNLKL